MSQSRETLLISRVVDGDATTTEWDELTALAERDPAVWHRFAGTLRDHKAFARAVNSAVEIAERVEMPFDCFPEPGVTPSPELTGDRSSLARPIAVIGQWTGWAVAAVIALAWVSGWFKPLAPSGPSNVEFADRLSPTDRPTTADEALQHYVDLGRREGNVVGMPERVLVDSRPAPDGNGMELLYMQPILQRETVRDAWQLDSRDEGGRPTLIRYEQPKDDRSPM